MTHVALSIGGNEVPDFEKKKEPREEAIEQTFRAAIRKCEMAGLKDINVSPMYQTTPVGCAPGTPDFLNGAFTGNWSGTLDALFRLCKKIEIEAGRPLDHPRWASRTLDLDIVFFGKLIHQTESLTIPHPEALKRLFVLIPLAEVAGNIVFPGQNGKTVQYILDSMKNQQEYDEIIAGKRPFPLF